jgi:hypothetical protein
LSIEEGDGPVERVNEIPEPRHHGRTAGASIGIPRARDIKYSSSSTSSGAP